MWGHMKSFNDADCNNAECLAKHIKKLKIDLKDKAVQKAITKSSSKFRIRKAIIPDDSLDPTGLERIIGKSDLVSINFLSKGLRAASSVCKIHVPMEGGSWAGTGFLIAPNLLMTNHHVLRTREEASQAEAEFQFENDVDNVLSKPVQFNLSPHSVFFSDKQLDFTIVAINPYSNGGVPLERFGYLPLIPASGKGLHGEWTTIIQHPEGKPKQISVRSNQIIDVSMDAKNHKSDDSLGVLAKDFVHYVTDTDRGSSGAPVLNDQWQVVAIHHKGVPDPKHIPDLRSGKLTAQDPSIEWIANQGVRISAIHRKLHSQRFTNTDAAKVLENLSPSIGLKSSSVKLSIGRIDETYERQSNPRSARYWTDKWAHLDLGYKSDFLPVDVSLETILNPVLGQLADRLDGNGKILDYLHFSAAIHEGRKCPLITAVNIKGSDLKHPGNRPSWRRDIRMHEIFQPGDNFYRKDSGDDPVAFDRGHLVRRFDPCWGTMEEVKIAHEHTFCFSNVAPQVNYYNGQIWGDLEDYILNQAQTKEKNVTIFTGPIFRSDDPNYGATRVNGPWKIPVSYWKVAIIEKPEEGDGGGDRIAAAGFLNGQFEYIQELYERQVFKLNPYTAKELQDRNIQVDIQKIMDLTGLDFSMLLRFDRQNALESTKEVRRLNSFSDIII